MMDSLRAKLDSWASASRPLTEISSEVFPPPDIKKLTQKLEVEKQAKKDGENNLPSSSAQTPSHTEGRIIAEFTELSSEYHRQYQQHSDAYRDRYNAVTRWWKMDLIANEEQSLVKDVIAAAKNKSGPVISEKENLVGAATQLSRFRERNQLTQRLPHIHDAWRQLSIIVVFVILEFLASIFLLREAGELTMLMILVLMFVMLNTVSPIYLFGPASRLMFYNWKQPIKKFVGILIFLAVSGAGLMLNLLIGHYRAAVMKFQDQGAVTVAEALGQFDRQGQLAVSALDSFFESMFVLPDVWSWLLVALNLILFFYALYEGIVKDDYYPGYGKLTRIFRDAEERYNDLIEDTQEELNQMRKQGIEDINRFKSLLTNSFTKAPQLREKHLELHNLCVNRLGALQLHCTAILRQYRQINDEYRSTPSPAYFKSLEEVKFSSPIYYEIEKVEPNVNKLIGRTEIYVAAVAAQFSLIDEKIQGADHVLTGLNPLKVE